MTITDCLVILVASGQGDRCERFIAELRDYLLASATTGELRIEILRRQARDHGDYRTIAIGAGRLIAEHLKPVHPFYFGNERPMSLKPRRPKEEN